MAALLVTCVAVYTRSAVVQGLADTVIFSKADSYSGLERLNSVTLAGGYFLQYPVLGVGWGSVTSHDLVFKLLANTGAAGLIAFALFLKSLVAGLWRSAAGARRWTGVPQGNYWGFCMLLASFILILTNVFTEFAYVFGHLWFVFGMSLAIPLAQNRRSSASLARVQQATA